MNSHDRIAIIGATGSGKTTLAKELARRLQIPHIELDALYWGPHWEARPPAVVRALIEQALTGEGWTVDGNYNFARDLIWPRANVLVWLDYPLLINFWRITARTLRRVISREELWNGNREEWRFILSRDSLHVWLFESYWKLKRRYQALVQQPEYQHLQVVHLKSPTDASQWLEAFTKR